MWSLERGRCALVSMAVLAAGVTALTSACGTTGVAAPRASAKPDAKPDAKPHSATGTPVTGSTTSSGACEAGRVVINGVQLAQALATATPGAAITLAPGTYRGPFEASTPGTSSSPITLCGSRDAVIDGGTTDSGYALYLNGASWWNLSGFSVQGGQKGLVLDRSSHVVISSLYVHDVGDEAVHLRSFSTYDTVEGVVVRSTGHHNTFFGEGIYVGSAHKNWCRYSNCAPDASDYNVIKNNDISETTAENIDIKEGTSGGTITGNQLSGVGMVESAATSWINVKGNGWTVSQNTGTQSLRDGFSVHVVYPGWGQNNVFHANTANVEASGYGFYIQDTAVGTVVGCDNTAVGAAAGLSSGGCS